MLINACILAILLLVFRALQTYANNHERAQFGKQSKSKYGRMTVVERLVAAGLFPEFTSAAGHGDVNAMIGLLIQVEFDQHESCTIAERIVHDPEEFGFSKRPPMQQRSDLR